MNINYIYIFSIIALIIFPIIGYFCYFFNSKTEENNQTRKSNHDISGLELTQKLIALDKLKNVKITKLNNKKTNYYSSKYNVIKLNPFCYFSSELSSLAVCANCENQARLAQQKTLFFLTKTAISIIANIISAIFLPSLLILAIINTSNPSNINAMILLVFLICFTLSFIFQAIILVFELISTKKCKENLNKLNLFQKDELEFLSKQLTALSVYNFYKFTRMEFSFFNLLVPNFRSASDNN